MNRSLYEIRDAALTYALASSNRSTAPLRSSRSRRLTANAPVTTRINPFQTFQSLNRFAPFHPGDRSVPAVPNVPVVEDMPEVINSP